MEWRFYDDSATLVKDNIGWMNLRADTALSAVQQTISALGSFQPGADGPNPNKFDLPAINLPSVVVPIPGVGAGLTMVGGVDNWNDPVWENIALSVGLDSSLVTLPGPFAPVTPLPTFGAAPGPIDTSGLPTHPTNLATITVPSPPTFVAPPDPVFIDLNIPPSPGFDDPAFAGVRPTFTGVAPTDNWLWDEPAYNSSTLASVQARVAAMLAGGTGLPTIVQQALFDAARSRENLTALASVQQAYDEWSARGFGMPPGMLVKSVDAANEKNRLSENTLQREILTKAATWEIENIRFAVERGIALETMLHNWFEDATKRSFEASKYHLEVEIKLYETAIALYNSQQSAYQTDAVVFKALIDAGIAKLTAWKTEIEGEIAKGQINEQNLKLYLGRLEGVKTAISIYSEQIKGVQAQADVNRSILEGYSTDVKAYGELLSARKVVFDAYDSEMKGKTAQIGAYEAEARAFAETVKAAEAEGNVKIKFVDAQIAALRASTDKYTAKLQAERERVQSELAQVQAKTSAYSADTARYSVELQGANQARGQEIQIAEMRLRNNLAYYETQLKEYDAALARQVHRVELILDALKASGQFGTALAAGAMSAIHVQAGISGAGHVNDSVSYNHTFAHKA
jgi:hypothetical protein